MMYLGKRNNYKSDKMIDYFAKGNKTIYCKDKHPNSVPFMTTIFKCSECECINVVKFFGTIKDKQGKYIY